MSTTFVPFRWDRLFALFLATVCSLASLNAAELVEVRKIWDQSPHNAFTDLVRWKDRFWCVFREGKGHVSPDGAVRILSSNDGLEWVSAGRFESGRSDLRDPKICVTPAGELMISAAGAIRYDDPKTRFWENYVWFSKDGRNWSAPRIVGEKNLWLWRVTWNGSAGLGIGYDTTGEEFIRLYKTSDGVDYQPLVQNLFSKEQPNEHGLVFLPDGAAICLLRRDGKPGHGLMGRSTPPYTNWSWTDVGQKIGGPSLLRLEDGRLIAVVRLMGKTRTSVCTLDQHTGRLREELTLPSGGDCSYAGQVWFEGELWVSYYSSHEGKTSIYLARVRL